MNKILWKLDRIGEGLRNLSTLTATQAAALANDGRGMAVVAEETRKLANKIIHVVEKAIFDNEEIEKTHITELAFQLNLLALNNAFEAFRLGHLGKQAAVCAEEVRIYAREIVVLLGKEKPKQTKQTKQTLQSYNPYPKNPLTSIGTSEYLLFDIGGIPVLENLENIKEACAYMEHKDSVLNLRGMELPLVDSYKMLGKTQEEQVCVILQTPWAEQNKTYAVTADILGIHRCPIGKAMAVSENMPLAKYVRECWENEAGDMFYFMDWTKMYQ